MLLSAKIFTFAANKKSFTEYTRTLLGEEEYTRLSTALLGEEQPVSIRLNPLKFGRSSFFTLHPSLKEVPWATDAYYLDQRLTFTFDPLFHAGCYCRSGR